MFPRGVLPNAVARDPKAEAMLVSITLRDDLDRAGAQGWLEQVSAEISTFATEGPRGRVAWVAVGLGPSFFRLPSGDPRFGLDGRMPVGFAQLPQVSVAEPGSADVLLYVMVTEEASAAAFLTSVASTKASIATISVERGFQRGDGRELFGFPDGLRNAPYPGRYGVVFVDREANAPDEPDWAEDGTYLAYLKIQQNLEAFAALLEDDGNRVLGRRRTDGSRLDLEPGTDVRSEPAFSSGEPPVTSHVRKAGPRGPNQDAVQIFRRGVPYLGLEADGSVNAGLHFVSFQATLEQFDQIFSAWMMNSDFPGQGAGQDELFRGGYATILRAGFYFVPPLDDRYLGARIFDPPATPVRPREVGRVIVRKRAHRTDGTLARVELGGCVFQVLGADQLPVGEPFTTDSAGHAMSGDLPVRTPLTLREVQSPSHLQVAGDQPFQIEERRALLVVDDQVVEGYGG